MISNYSQSKGHKASLESRSYWPTNRLASPAAVSAPISTDLSLNSDAYQLQVNVVYLLRVDEQQTETKAYLGVHLSGRSRARLVNSRLLDQNDQSITTQRKPWGKDLATL